MKTQKNIASIAELKKQFAFISPAQLQFEKEHNSYKTIAGFMKYLQRINAEHEQKAVQPDVRRLVVQITWKKSKIWGYNPHAEYWCTYKNDELVHGFASCSGCGYDKESTVLARVYNACCIGMLWRKRNTRKPAPYGVSLNAFFPYFEGGIGAECYTGITTFLGGTLRKDANGKLFDQYSAIWK